MGELYKDFRPEDFDSVHGQKTATSQLQSWIARGDVPHAILMTGPSGVGKTTCARILRKAIGCGDRDYQEKNAALDSRGIDSIREIQEKWTRTPTSGKCAVYLIDECHALTAAAFQSLLKLTEDHPEKVYFIFCTTDPSKIPATLKTRLTAVAFQGIEEGDLRTIADEAVVCWNTREKEKQAKAVQAGKTYVEKPATVSDKVLDKIAEYANGSARQALVWLNQVMHLSEPEALQVVQPPEQERNVFEIAQALYRTGCTFASIAPKLAALPKTVEFEGLRHMILNYGVSMVLKQPGTASRVGLVLDAFSEPFFNTGKAGFTLACIVATSGK